MTIQQIIKPAFLTTEHRHVHLKQTKIYPHHSPHRHHRTDLWRPLGLVLLGLGRCHWSTGTSASHRDERATTNAMGEKWVKAPQCWSNLIRSLTYFLPRPSTLRRQ